MTYKNILINNNSTIKEALHLISKEGVRCLIVTDTRKKMLGTLSEGDLRRSILKEFNLNNKIKSLYKKKPRFFFEDEIDNKKIKKFFLKEKLDLIPIVDQNKKIVKVIFWNDIFNKSILKKRYNVDVVIMSGGKGKRLLPFTEVLPKALIPIKEKPVISHIIDNFKEQGFGKMKAIVNYKADVLKAYLSQYKRNDKINIFHEKKPLGTAGGLFLLKQTVSKLFFVSNCDILTNFNYKDLLDFHCKNKNDFTLVASAKNFPIPYGVCELKKKGTLKRINEKPNLDFLVSIGLYLVDKKILSLIKKDSFLDMSDLINKLQLKKYKVGVFPIDDSSWTDVGEWNKYEETLKSYD